MKYAFLFIPLLIANLCNAGIVQKHFMQRVQNCAKISIVKVNEGKRLPEVMLENRTQINSIINSFDMIDPLISNEDLDDEFLMLPDFCEINYILYFISNSGYSDEYIIKCSGEKVTPPDKHGMPIANDVELTSQSSAKLTELLEINLIQ